MKEQTIIIFEGHDKSGKSTIAKALSKELDIPMFKVQRSKYWWDPMTNLNYLTEGITQFIEQMGTSVILDRWIGSDYMYSKLFNRDISYRKIWEIDERLSKLNTLVVICYKDKEAYIPDHDDKEFVDESKYTEMTSYINEYAQQSKCKCIHINTSDENLEAQVNKIIENI